MILTYFGLDLSCPFRLVDLNNDRFEECSLLASCSTQSDEINIALSDFIIFQQTLTPQKLIALNEFIQALSAQRISVKAIDTESQAIARALHYFDPASVNECRVIFNISYSSQKEHRLWLSTHQNKNTLFFHEEKIHVESGNITEKYISFLYRALKLLKLKQSELKINKYYLLTPDTNLRAWLIASGLSLWNEKENHNYLPKLASSLNLPLSFREKKLMMKQLLKTIFYGFAILLVIHLALISFLHIEKNKSILLQKKLSAIHTQSQSLISLKTRLQSLNQQTNSFTLLQNNLHLPIPQLESLGHIMPEGVFLNSLAWENNNISITGRAQLEDQIQTLHKNLISDHHFEHVSIKNISQDESTPPYHYSFIIETENKGENNVTRSE